MATTRRYGPRVSVLLGTALALLTSFPVAAQTLEDRRLLVGVSGGIQFVKDSILHKVDFELFQETGKFTASYDITTDTAFDGSIAVRLYKRMGVGVDVSHFNKLMTATVEAEVPHPFFFSFPRMTTGLAGGITRREIAVHIQAQYWHVIADDFLVRGFFGPTIFDISHDLVSEIVTSERGFDFDEVDIVRYRTIKADSAELGFNVGLDASYFVLDHFALAVVLRYSRGTSHVEIAGQAQQALELGGTHLAGGLRLIF